MTLSEALQYFDELDPKMHVDRLTAEGQDIGVPYCCGLPVVKNSQLTGSMLCLLPNLK